MVNTRYRLDEVLGTGGTGLVYKAFDEFERRTVAMKRIASEKLASKKDKDRAQALFEREYHVLAELAHPKIIQVYDYGVDEDGPYYTMEWLQGKSLRNRAPLPFKEVCRLVRDVASSLAIVHSRRLVHRDVTPHNIHCSDDGHAKLIDFGAMTPFGVPKVVVGTPPFMAPECIHFQPVDGRTDLFSLGACLYYALTGRHAYPARTIGELADVWRTSLVWPSRLAAEVPEALDRLVLELLSRDPAGRPSSAAEVFERLTTIAELDDGEHPTVARAYLSSPALSGRRQALGRILRRALRATRGRGSAITLAGPGGIGRSRLFDAAVLEAKLSGFVVLRGDTSEGRTAPFAGIRSLVRTLGEADPAAAAALAACVASRGEADGKKQDVAVNEAAKILRQASARRSIAVCVDDVHLLDDESVAILALLASGASALRLLVLTTLDTGADRPRDPALALLQSSSARIELPPLTDEETRRLLSSLFGEVPNVDTVSTVLAERARGNARELLDAAQSLVDHGLARYAGGAWTLPNDPAAVRSALADLTDVARRVQHLTPEGRRLLGILALDRDGIMGLHDYADLVFDGNRATLNRALSELLSMELVRLSEDRCSFAREEYRSAGAASLPDSERKRLHGLLAERAESIGANAIYAGYHYFHAGKPGEAGAAMNRFRDALEASPGAAIVRQPIVLDTVELIVGSTGYSPAFLAEHGAGMVINAVYQGLPERAAPHAPRALERLAYLTALTDYHARTELDPGERLGMAFGLAASRCDDPTAPGINPVTAVRRLCQLSITTAICARFMNDPALLEHIPDLSPFAPLSPAVAFAARLVAAIGMLARGQDWVAWDAIASLYADLNGPAAEGIDDLTRLALRSSVLGQLCALECEYGSQDTLAHLAEFAPMMPDLAESCRARYFLSRGMSAEAAAARRQFELISAQSHGLQEARNIELPTYLALQAMSDDLLGLKRTLASLVEVAKTRPFWQARVAIASAHVARCRGDYGKGLSIVEASLETMPNGSAAWAATAALRVTLLDLAGVPGAAIEAGIAYLATARTRRVPIVGIGLALAAAHARVGDTDAADHLYQELKTLLEERGAAGIILGRCFEVGAFIASRRGDRTGFEERADACAGEYRRGENAALTARYDALLRADQRSRTMDDEHSDYATVVVGRRRAPEPGTSRDGSGSSSLSSDVHADVLALLVERAGARGGFLYTWTDGSWSRVFGTPGLEAPSGLDAAVLECIASRTEGVTQTMGATTATAPGAERHWFFASAAGDRLVPCLLEDDAANDHVVGVAVLAVGTEGNVDIPTTSLAAAARALAPHQHIAG